MPNAAPAQPAIGPVPVGELEDILTDINPETGAVLEEPDVPQWQRETTYVGIAELALTDAQILVLTEPPTDTEIEIKPDSFGAVYLSHASYRRRLNKAFKPGGWSQRQIAEWRYDPDTKQLTAEFALYARGSDNAVCFVSKAIGGQKYHGGSGRGDDDKGMTYDDAAQGAESNALMRNCKQLGIALELWEKRSSTAIRNRLGICVLIKRRDGSLARAWRRWEDGALPFEQNIAPDSPNAEKYRRTVQPAQQQPAQQPQQERPQPPQPRALGPKPADAPAQPGPVASEWGKNGIITMAQARRLYTLVGKSGIPEASIGTYLQKKFGYTSSKQIKKEHYDVICKWVQGGGD